MPRDKTGHFYYEWYPSIYQADTQHLTLAEDGAYRRLIDHYMTTKAPLPNDDRALARIIGIGLTEWESIKNPVITYFKPTGLFLHHNFCDEVLSRHASRINKSQNNGKNGGRPSIRKTKEITQPVLESKPIENPITEQNRTEQSISSDTNVSSDTPEPQKLCKMPFKDFPPDWKEWALKDQGWSNDILADVWEDFREYWTVGKGKNTKRGNWSLSWRKWCRGQNIKQGGGLNAKPRKPTRFEQQDYRAGTEGFIVT